MPYYAGLRKADDATRIRTAKNLVALRGLIRETVPSRTLAGNLLIASWNIREFDSAKYGGRTPEAIYYIAEILSHFDLVAIQEVREDIDALQRVLRLLGSWWKYLVTDVTEGQSGNGERMAFLYDSRKVTFDGLAGEIVLPPDKVKSDVLQFARTPFICGFRSGWSRIDLCTVHIYYGTSKPLDERRLEEIRKLANFLAARAKKDKKPANLQASASSNSPLASRTLVLLGDFNIFANGDATLKAIKDAGFVIPEKLTDRPGSNLGRDKFYDQIAIWRGRRFGETEIGGVLDYYQAVFRPEDEATYQPMIAPTKSGKKPTYKDWKTYQMSDHLLLWSAFKVDFADDYLQELSG